ncbi:MAG: methanol/ethanol family PQQ-dependent dehydrogenase [Flavisolibacter sp.]
MNKKQIIYFRLVSWIFFYVTISGDLLAQSFVPSGDWLTFNRTYNGDRYSPLKQITQDNIGKLHMVAKFDLDKDVCSLQTGPLVIEGVMYFTSDTVTYAINAATGMLKWKTIRKGKIRNGYGSNRGVAYYGGRIFRGTSDSHVIALNTSDGKIVWDVTIAEASLPGISIPMAPIAWNGLLFVGHAEGEESKTTGHIYALDVNDGHVVWKFNVVPDSGYARETWPKTLNELSGGTFWTTFSLDTEFGILYAPCGNTPPDFEVDVNRSEKLYTNCVVALDIKKGTLLGYIQLVKRDFHDWEVSSAPVLITTNTGRRIFASSNKDGLLSVVDRSALASKKLDAMDSPTPFKLIYAVPTTIRENMDVPFSSVSSTHFKPGFMGGSEWNGPAFDSALKLIFTGTNDWGSFAKIASTDSLQPSRYTSKKWMGEILGMDSASKARGWVTAFNLNDGSVRWKFKAPAPVLGGVTPTAGGLVFTSSQNGDLYSFNSKTGKLLWKSSTHLATGGGVISYSVNGKQYIAIAVGLKSKLWPNPSKASRILIYGL